MIRAYRNYPHHIPARVKIFNVFRYVVRFPPIEEWIAQRILKGSDFCKRMVPPIYFYRSGSVRRAFRSGVLLDLDLSNLVDHAIFFGTPKEPGWEKLFSLAKTDAVVMDIGANIGFLTLVFSRICTHGFVYAFEPSTRNFRSLIRNLSLNHPENVKAFQTALGEKPESKTLYEVYAFNSGANRILNTPNENPLSETVVVDTLDNVAQSLSLHRLDILKIDVEGFELFVLRGGEKVIQKFQPVLFVELSDENLRHHDFSSKDVVKFIRDLGYKITDARTMQPFSLQTKLHADVLCFPAR